MIITVEKAKILLGITDDSKDIQIEEKLKGLEITIRNLTNNKFQDKKVREIGNYLIQGNKVMGVNFLSLGFRKDNTIEISGSVLNDGIYEIIEVGNNSIILDRDLEEENTLQTLITKIKYPYDIVQGAIKLLDYDFKMSDKIGIKSETIARYSVTYYDVNSSENIEGYPSSLMKFLNKYKKLRW